MLDTDKIRLLLCAFAVSVLSTSALQSIVFRLHSKINDRARLHFDGLLMEGVSHLFQHRRILIQ
jgi:hypothetical protein